MMASGAYSGLKRHPVYGVKAESSKGGDKGCGKGGGPQRQLRTHSPKISVKDHCRKLALKITAKKLRPQLAAAAVIEASRIA
jgi:hypothetical protein